MYLCISISLLFQRAECNWEMLQERVFAVCIMNGSCEPKSFRRCRVLCCVYLSDVFVSIAACICICAVVSDGIFNSRFSFALFYRISLDKIIAILSHRKVSSERFVNITTIKHKMC